MQPSLKEGQIVWVTNWSYLFSKPKVGDIVVFFFQNRELIKRISQVKLDSVEVVGDNKADSLASNELGNIAIKDIVGKVWP